MLIVCPTHIQIIIIIKNNNIIMTMVCFELFPFYNWEYFYFFFVLYKFLLLLLFFFQQSLLIEKCTFYTQCTSNVHQYPGHGKKKKYVE